MDLGVRGHKGGIGEGGEKKNRLDGLSHRGGRRQPFTFQEESTGKGKVAAKNSERRGHTMARFIVVFSVAEQKKKKWKKGERGGETGYQVCVSGAEVADVIDS